LCNHEIILYLDCSSQIINISSVTSRHTRCIIHNNNSRTICIVTANNLKYRVHRYTPNFTYVFGVYFKAVCYKQSVLDTPCCPTAVMLHKMAAFNTVKWPLAQFRRIGINCGNFAISQKTLICRVISWLCPSSKIGRICFMS